VRSAYESRPVVDAAGVASRVFDHLPLATAIIEAGPAPVIVAANRVLCRLTGYSSEQLVGMPLATLTPGVNDIMSRLPGDNHVYEAEALCVDADGDLRPVTIQVSGLPPGPDECVLAIVQVQEDTRQQEAERALRKSEQQLQDMADNVTALMYLKRDDGRYILINQRFEQLMGLERGTVQDKTDFDIWPEPIAVIYQANDRAVIEAGVPMEFEEPIPTAEGGAWGMWLTLKFPLFDEDGTLYAVGGVSTDISDRNRAEAAIRAARDEAERANRAKSDFLSRMSHEFRTPLNSILGFGQLLQMQELPPQAAEGVNCVVRAGRHLLNLTNELLEITRIETGGPAVTLAPVHACDPLNEAFELVRPLAAERGVELARDLHGALYRFVLADAQRLKQVLLNVLMNAVKYNHDGGMVTVSAEADGERLRFRVIDTGLGLDPGDVDRIFLPFERLAARGTDTEGTGLGLALSRSLVEEMGGTIGVERSVKGKGSVFFVEVALTDSAGLEDGVLFPQDPMPLAGASAELASMTVLYIEDNLANLELVRQVLAHVGSPRLLSAMQGHIGIELAAQHRPDLVLLDLHLPDIDGEHVLRLMLEDERTRDLPVVILSADATPTQIERLKARGAADYVTKPLEIPAFLQVVRRAVGRPS
jgi:PAS domain S-box-containing protein